MNSAQLRRLKSELSEAMSRCQKADLEVFDRNILITGASGFVGGWLLASWLVAKQEFGAAGGLTCVSRRLSGYSEPLYREAAAAGVDFQFADVRRLPVLRKTGIELLVHGATPTVFGSSREDLAETVSTIIDGQRGVLEFCLTSGVSRVLFLSSGAIYGRRSLEANRISEDDETGPDPLSPANAYHEAKRMAETLGATAAASDELEFVSARLFAFLAPLLPLDAHFAAGNFIRDALHGEDLQLSGTGRSVRSYQYGTDLVTWLWTILLRGQSRRAYNVGSATPVSIEELARQIIERSGRKLAIHRPDLQRSGTDSSYVPDVSRSEYELGLVNHISLGGAIDRTLSWHSLT